MKNVVNWITLIDLKENKALRWENFYYFFKIKNRHLEKIVEIIIYDFRTLIRALK